MEPPLLLPILSDTPQAPVLRSPEVGVVVDAMDRIHRKGYRLKDWTRSVNCTTTTWQGSTIVGLQRNSSSTSVDLTKTVKLPRDGLYRIEIRVRRDPTTNGTMTFYDDTTQIGDPISLYHKWAHYERIVYPVRYYEAGSHDFKVTITRPGYVESIFIYPLYRYTGGAFQDIHSTGHMEISNVEFTQNGFTELDILSLETPMKNEYWEGRNDSLLKFGLTDHITLFVGQKKRELQPAFGGYITGPVPSDDGDVLTLNAVSRFMDWNRQPVYHDFAIGTVPAGDGTQTEAYVRFGDVHTLCEYLASTLEYPVNTAGIPTDYGFIQTFSSVEDFNSVYRTGGFRVDYDTTMGVPRPCLRITPDYAHSNSSVVLYHSGDVWDAVDYPIFNTQIYPTGSSPLTMDLVFTMHKTDETIGDALDYRVRLNGTQTSSRVIGKAVFNVNTRKWQTIQFNLKDMFDKYSHSSNYYISKVALVGSITTSQVNNRGAWWVDNVYSFKKEAQAPQYTSDGVNYPFEELQKLCTDTSHTAYIKPGVERRDDMFVVKPLEIAFTDQEIRDGHNGTLLNIQEWNNDPLNDGICNQAHRTFNYDENRSGSSFSEDWDSIIDYGPFQDHEFLDNVNNKDAAYQIAKQHRMDNSRVKPGFSVVNEGNILIEPNHYILCNTTRGRLYGYHHILSMTHNIDPEYDIYTTTLDLNKPSKRFTLNIKRFKQNLGWSNNQTAYNRYREAGLTRLARNSSGSFLQL